MTTAFSTWRELSFLIAPLIAAIALASGAPCGFWLLHLVLACLLGAAGASASFLPRRM